MRSKLFYINTDNYLTTDVVKFVVQTKKGFSVFEIDKFGKVVSQSFSVIKPDLIEDHDAIDKVSTDILNIVECLSLDIPKEEILGKILFVIDQVKKGFHPRTMDFHFGNILIDISSSLQKEEILDEDLSLFKDFNDFLEEYFYKRKNIYQEYEKEFIVNKLMKVYQVFNNRES